MKGVFVRREYLLEGSTGQRGVCVKSMKYAISVLYVNKDVCIKIKYIGF